MYFNWTRPSHLACRNIWLKFKGKDVKTDYSVDYVIKDISEDRFDEAIQVMVNGFLADAPMAKLKNALSDTKYVEDITRIWKIILDQRMSYMCLKDGSEEIVGLYMSYVASKDDPPLLYNDIKSESFSQIIRVHSILQDYGKFNVFEKYGVDKYFSSFGVYVPKQFAGRKIGEKLLEVSKYTARPCELKLRHGFFTSNISNKIADNLRYKTDVELSFEEIQRIDPSIEFENIDSNKAALRTWIFEGK